MKKTLVPYVLPELTQPNPNVLTATLVFCVKKGLPKPNLKVSKKTEGILALLDTTVLPAAMLVHLVPWEPTTPIKEP